MWVRLWMRSSFVRMLSGHSLVLGALPSSTSSSSRGIAPVTVASSSSSSFPLGTLGTLVPLLTPRRLFLELGATLEFLTLGLMENRELPQVPLGEADDSVEGERPPSRGPGCSASLLGKTKGIVSSLHVCVSNPQHNATSTHGVHATTRARRHFSNPLRRNAALGTLRSSRPARSVAALSTYVIN